MAEKEQRETFRHESPGSAPQVRRFRLTVLEGPAAGQTWSSTADRCSIGSQPGNDLVVDDPTVSRFHCEIALERRARLADLGSKNGTMVDGVSVETAYLRANSVIRLGATAIRFELEGERNVLAVSSRSRFGVMVGRSLPMRLAFALLERAATSDATVLLDGETGTGKGEAAASLHTETPRRAAEPFVVVDCSAIPDNLLESELFGHERGAFTGAVGRRIGAFEEAAGGTLFLDEIGELPANLQPKLLRVLEARTLRRVGGTGEVKVGARVVAATNRDLRAEVNAGRFRADLFYRLSVLRVTLPPLRQRPDDLPDLAAAILDKLGADPEQRRRFTDPAFVQDLARSSWPGNVRELRNHLERCLVFDDAMPLEETGGSSPPPGGSVPPDARRPFTEARDDALAAFEREYLKALLREHGGRVGAAARSAGIGRVYLWKLLSRHGLKATT